MARTRALGDTVLRVGDLGKVPGVVSNATGVDSNGQASATGATINVFDPRSPADKARPGSIQNTDGTTLNTWDFAAFSGLKLASGTATADTSGTINKPSGSFILSSGNAAYTLTNSFIGADSIVDVEIMTSGDTALVKSVVVTAGQVVVTLTGNVVADTTIGFAVINGN